MFCIRWRRSIWYEGRPNSRLLQLSRRELTNAWTRRSVVARSRCFLIFPMLRRANEALLQIVLMWDLCIRRDLYIRKGMTPECQIGLWTNSVFYLVRFVWFFLCLVLFSLSVWLEFRLRSVRPLAHLLPSDGKAVFFVSKMTRRTGHIRHFPVLFLGCWQGRDIRRSYPRFSWQI